MKKLHSNPSIKVLGSSSEGNCYIISVGGATLILECGISYKKIMKALGGNITDCIGCLVTHKHKDHSKEVYKLAQSGIEIFATAPTLESCEESYVGYNKIIAGQQFKLGDFTILPFETQHDCDGSIGFLIQHPLFGKLLFATDTYYVRYKFKGINHAFIEDNYIDYILESAETHGSLKRRIRSSHFEHSRVMDFLEANKGDYMNICLIHLSSAHSNEKVMKDDVEYLIKDANVFIGKPELEIDLSLTPF